MQEQVKIKRRVPTLNLDGRPIPGKYHEVMNIATVVKQNKLGADVQLANGDIVYRKAKDIQRLEVSNEQQT